MPSTPVHGFPSNQCLMSRQDKAEEGGDAGHRPLTTTQCWGGQPWLIAQGFRHRGTRCFPGDTTVNPGGPQYILTIAKACQVSRLTSEESRGYCGKFYRSWIYLIIKCHLPQPLYPSRFRRLRLRLSQRHPPVRRFPQLCRFLPGLAAISRPLSPGPAHDRARIPA